MAKWVEKPRGMGNGFHSVPHDVSESDYSPSPAEYNASHIRLDPSHKVQPKGAPGYRGGEVPWSSEGDNVGGSTHSQVWVAGFFYNHIDGETLGKHGYAHTKWPQVFTKWDTRLDLPQARAWCKERAAQKSLVPKPQNSKRQSGRGNSRGKGK